jgi:hypothetical protein
MTFSPKDGEAPADACVLSWSTLRDLGGPDAYYNAWISSGDTEAITEADLRGDNVFIGALLDPNFGRNAGSSQLGSFLDPLPTGPQTWQIEILDANQLDHIDQIIFPPGQHFVAQ